MQIMHAKEEEINMGKKTDDPITANINTNPKEQILDVQIDREKIKEERKKRKEEKRKKKIEKKLKKEAMANSNQNIKTFFSSKNNL